MLSELSCVQRDVEELRCAQSFSSDLENLYHKAYKRYHGYMVSAIRRRVRNLHDAEDICQEIFIDLLRNIEKVQNSKGWLLNSMMFYIPTYYRDSGRLNCYPLQVSDNIHDMEIKVKREDYEVKMIVDDMLSSFDNYEDEQQFIIFQLVALYHFSYIKTSQLIGKSTRQVNYHYHKVVMRMITYLRERGIDGMKDVYC